MTDPTVAPAPTPTATPAPTPPASAAPTPAPTAAPSPAQSPAPTPTPAPAPAASDDWRSDLPDDLKETANRFTSKADAVRAIIDMRKRESQVRVPGKDATPDQIAAYHKAIGVPEKPELYEFPDLPEGLELTDQVKESRAEWGKRFHSLGINKET